MSKLTLVALASLLVFAPSATTALETATALPMSASTPNEAPLADAGLDQEVTKGATVLLDGTRSRDPDGHIDSYRWTIQMPSNETITPDCADCPRTSFTPAEVGRYRVTLTVTDEDGASRSDTLYVDVSPGTEPTISISGSRQPTEGRSATYTANFDAGTAGLEYVVWTIDGTEIANHSLSTAQRNDSTTKHFPTAGERTITATVYDADGQSDTSSLSVTVQRRTPPPRRSPRTRTPIADRTAPTVTGDAVVTGTEPLRGRYAVRFDAPESVESVEWRNTAGRVGTGRSLTRTWQPGDHELYAVVTYTDGSRNVATFADGTTTVVADPGPNVTIQSLDRYGAISGTVTGIDQYENLDALRVEIDGETVATTRATVRGRYRLDADFQRTLRFSSHDFTPGEQYSVTVVATDERGQTSSVSQEIVPVKKPEVVRSEFVNDPVDSYHERLDPERYVAHHVLEIDLNGVDPEKLEVDFQGADERVDQVQTDEYQWEKKRGEATLFIESYWHGSSPSTYYISVSWSVLHGEDGRIWANNSAATFQVTPSKPELRLNVENDGTRDYITRRHGILVNASDSFDPDGTDLKYIWKYGAEPTKPDNTTAKFRAYERAASIIEDQYELRTKRNFNFLDYFVPDIAENEVLTEGPYTSNETVRVRVKTEPYHFSKKTYYQDFLLGLKVSNPKVNILMWNEVEAPDSQHSEPTENAYQYVAIVEIPASELSAFAERPEVVIYNSQNTRKKTETKLPEVGILVKDETFWTNVTIKNLTYLVEKPIIMEAMAETKQVRDEYVQDGYHVKQKEQTPKYVLEKRVQIQDAAYETITKSFSSERRQNLFLQSSPGWYPAGTSRQKETRTRQYSEWYSKSNLQFQQKWHDSDLRNGELTGATRRVVVTPAKYRTKKKYRYRYEVERTGARTVTRTRTVPITKTKTRTVTRCTLRFGCRETTVTYTYRTTKTYTYTTTETYTYTVTKTETYWSTSKYDPTHTFTGRTKRVQVQEAVHETEYEVRFKTYYTETSIRYLIARDTQVQKALYEWQARGTTDDYYLAKRQVTDRDSWRINETSVDTWMLVKANGTKKFWTPIYESENLVLKTKARIIGKKTRQFYNSKTEERIETSKLNSDHFTYNGYKSRGDIIEIISAGKQGMDWCNIKSTCSKGEYHE